MTLKAALLIQTMDKMVTCKGQTIINLIFCQQAVFGRKKKKFKPS